jgi:hypothetical protein
MRRVGVAAVLLVLAIPAGLAAPRLFDRTAGRPASAAPTLVADGPAAIRRLTVIEGDRRAVLVNRAGGIWVGEGTTPAESVALMVEFEDRLLPLHGYRHLAEDPARAEYGLAGPALHVEVENGAGVVRRIAVGSATFTGGGSYAALEGSPGIYLMARRTVDDLRSLAQGRRINTPRTEKETNAVREVTEHKLDDPVDTPWLRQAEAAGGKIPEDAR